MTRRVLSQLMKVDEEAKNSPKYNELRNRLHSYSATFPMLLSVYGAVENLIKNDKNKELNSTLAYSTAFLTFKTPLQVHFENRLNESDKNPQDNPKTQKLVNKLANYYEPIKKN